MKEFDIVVIGAGPGGYTAAIRASQLGFKTAIIEKDKLGGVCLNWGCIPTKALLKSAELMNTFSHSKEFGITAGDIKFNFPQIIERSRKVAFASEKGVQYLMKKNNIEVINGKGVFNPDKSIDVLDSDGNSVEKIISQHIIIATGARPRKLGNVNFDDIKILSSTGALLLKDIPKSITIVGSGAIGIEFAYFYNAFGADVTIIEMLPAILPIEDKEISDVVSREFRKKGIKIHTGTKTESVEISNNNVCTTVSGKLEDTIVSDAVLIAVGIQANIDNLGIENIGIETFKNGIKVNENYQTSVAGIYAIGDVALINPEGKPWLAHTASAEAINCIEKIKGLHNANIDYKNIPGCTYCQPQVASIGYTEEEVKKLNIKYKVGKFPFTANGKARAIGESAGLVKLIFDEEYGELLGAHIVGPEATELISELVYAKTNEGTWKSILHSIHPHPSLSEAIMESAGVALSEAINI
jgi:dihydrolipoamide dehydrogenase